MKKLLSIELKKVLTYATFWIMLGVYMVMVFMMFFFLRSIKLTGPLAFFNLDSYYSFPMLWHSLSWVASFFTLLLGMLVIILVTNEFTFRTVRQNIIDGLSKVDVLAAKLYLIILIALFATIVVFFTGIICGLITTENLQNSMIFEKINFLPAYFVQAIAYMCFALFVGTLVKKSGLAIGVFLLYKIIEWIAYYRVPSIIADYLPMHTISNLVQMPSIKLLGINSAESPLGIHFAFALIYSVVFVGGTYLLMTKRDL